MGGPKTTARPDGSLGEFGEVDPGCDFPPSPPKGLVGDVGLQARLGVPKTWDRLGLGDDLDILGEVDPPKGVVGNVDVFLDLLV